MYQFTSESVSSGHPDKVADQISDAVADLVLDGRRENRAAIETFVTTNRVVVGGEIKRHTPLENFVVEDTIRNVVKSIGYEQAGFHWRDLEISNYIHSQSADIALGTDDFGAGDQGLMFGYACAEAPEYMPTALYYSHAILKDLEHRRKGGQEWLGPDAKAQLTVEYAAPNKPLRVSKVVVSTQHAVDVTLAEVQSLVFGWACSVLGDLVDEHTEFLINPTGQFVIGGPDGDAGVTGRKIIVDTYGGYAPHGGGAFSGKDPTKVDRSAAYMARYLAKNIVHSTDFSNATVQLSYAIGVKEPTSLYVYADGETRPDLAEKISKNIDLTPLGIIDRFDMFSVQLTDTTTYGHFGKPHLPWEKLDLDL